MSRGLATNFKTALGASVLYPGFFAEFDFSSGVNRYWTGISNISADLGDGSVTWIGGGLFGGFKASGEVETIMARSLEFTLNSVDQTYYATAIAANYQGRPVKLWFALLDSAGTTVSYYYLLEEARMDTLKFNESDSTLTLTLTCESRLVDMFSPHRMFLNNADLQKTNPTDTFYEYTPTLPVKKLPWGLYKIDEKKSFHDRLLGLGHKTATLGLYNG